ncbi:hypothetical protein FALCPG4_018233 [Fusarium falciforme]
MTETTRKSLDKDPVPHASPQSAQETPDEMPSNEINRPTSTTRDSHGSSVQASLPQPAPPSDSLDELLSQEVLEIICLHQAILGSSGGPAFYIAELKAKGKDAFMEDLASLMEGYYLLPCRGGHVSRGRIKDLQQQCGLRECPRNEQLTPDPPDSWRSISCSREVYERMLVFTAQEFGRLGYMLPARMNSDKLLHHLALLISLWEDRRMRGEDIGTSKSELDRRIQTLRKNYSSLFPNQHS